MSRAQDATLVKMAQKSLKISLSEAENSASEQGSGNEKKTEEVDVWSRGRGG